MAKRLALLLAAFFFGGRLAALLDGDLRDEVAHLPDRGLRLFLAGGLDDVLDLLARRRPSPRIEKSAWLSSCATRRVDWLASCYAASAPSPIPNPYPQSLVTFVHRFADRLPRSW